MKSPIEEFIRNHKDEFDSEEPSGKVWDAIQQKMQPGQPAQKKVIQFNFTRWAAAAAVILLAASGAWFLIKGLAPSRTPTLATGKPVGSKQNAGAPEKELDGNSTLNSGNQNDLAQNNDSADKSGYQGSAAYYDQEMYYYTKLIELKHNELKKVEKDEPLLYKEFSGDVKKLDSVYQILRNQLPNNPNRAQLIEAMIQNLNYK